MVLTTHYLEEAETLCDRIAIMNEGTVARDGTLSELVNSVSAEITVSSVHTPPRLPGTTITTEQKKPHNLYKTATPGHSRSFGVGT